MTSAGASGTVKLAIKDRTSRLKLYIAKTLQKFTLPCWKFVVSKQWAVVQFPVGLLVFVKDVSPQTMSQGQEDLKYQQMNEV
jgi:hypothetical protein